jgi:hypothetical protein
MSPGRERYHGIELKANHMNLSSANLFRTEKRTRNTAGMTKGDDALLLLWRIKNDTGRKNWIPAFAGMTA